MINISISVFAFLACLVLVYVGAQTCTDSVSKIEACSDTSQASPKYLAIYAKRQDIIGSCFKQNSQLQQCPLLVMQQCQDKAKADSAVQSAKTQMLRSINNCLANGRDVLAVLQIVRGGRTENTASLGGGTGSSDVDAGLWTPDSPTTTPAPAINCNDQATSAAPVLPGFGDISSLFGGSLGALGGQASAANLGALGSLLSGGSALNGLGGASQILGMGRKKKQVDFGQLFNQGLSQFFGNSATPSTSPAPSPTPAPSVDQCPALLTCVNTGELKETKANATLATMANDLYTEYMDCIDKARPPLNCLPNTASQVKCINGARKAFDNVKSTFMKNCLQAGTTPAAG